MQNKDFEYIKKFFSITQTKLCKDLNLSRSVMMSGKGKEEDYKIMRKAIELEIAKLSTIKSE